MSIPPAVLATNRARADIPDYEDPGYGSPPAMEQISYRCHRLPAEIIEHAVGPYCRFSLRFRDVEDLLAGRGLDISYETVRRWVLKFGRKYAHQLRRFRPRPDDRWHLDEMFVTIGGKRMDLWRAVDAEGEVLHFLIQSKRTKAAALKRHVTIPA